MLSKTFLRRVKTKILTRTISFFGKKKPSTCGDDKDCVFDMQSCLGQKPSSLKVKESCTLEGCCSLPKVIIIGAGMTGMSAASRLLNAGVKDVLVLEATCRPGGRIMSAWVGDAMIEFGPRLLGGASVANPVFNLANMAGALRYPLTRLSPRKRVFLTSDGSLITNYDVEFLLYQQLISDTRRKENSKPLGACGCHHQCNLMQYIGLRLQQELLNFPRDMQPKSEKVLWGMLNSLRAMFGADLSQISSDSLADRAQTPGGTIIVEGGMHRLLAPMLQEIPEKQLLFNTPVLKVTLEQCPVPGKAVVVESCDRGYFEADYVIVTIPLGVLKKRGKSMFGSALSEQHLKAIQNIGVGQHNHIYLEYAHPWWIPGMADMTLAWGMEELQVTNDWTKGIAAIHEVPGSKHLIAIEMAGPEAEIIESVAEEEVAIQATKFLRKFTNDTSIPFPTNIVLTRWSCDPFFHGSSVFMGVDTTPGMFNDLGGSACSDYSGPPVDPIIWAGDATIPKYYGTVEGARRSGLRAANKIIRSTKVKCAEESERNEHQVDCEPEEETQQAQQCC